MGLNTWCHSISVTFFCALLGAQGIRATGFKRTQGNGHWAKFERNTNSRMTFETNAISTTSGIQTSKQETRILILKLAQPVTVYYWIECNFSQIRFCSYCTNVPFWTTITLPTSGWPKIVNRRFHYHCPTISWLSAIVFMATNRINYHFEPATSHMS